MSEEIESTVNAEPVVNVEPQEVEQVETTESVNADNSEVASPEVEKPVQTPEENANFAAQRRAREQAEQRAEALERDHSIAKTYGAEWGVFSEGDITEKYGHLGITTLDQFEEAVREHEMQQKGIDPEVVNQYVENDPRVKKAAEWEAKQAEQAKFQEESNEFFALFKEENGRAYDVDNDTIPPKMAEQLEKGKTLADAYAHYLLHERREKAKAEDTNKANAESSTGSLTGKGGTGKDFISFDTFNANKHDSNWVMKNFSKINESRSKW